MDEPPEMQQSYSIVNTVHLLNASEMNRSVLLAIFSMCSRVVRDIQNDTIAIKPFGSMPSISKDDWKIKYEFFFDVLFVGTVLMAGITGNILSYFVLLRDRSHGTTNLILTSLAVCDTLFLIGCLFFQFLRTLSVTILWLEYMNFYAHSSKFLYGIGMAVRMMRNWMIALVTVERWIAVCKPLHAPSICTRKKARIAITMIVVFSLLYNIPHFFIVTAIQLFCYGSSTTASSATPSAAPLEGILIYHSARRPWIDKTYAFQLGYRIIGYTIMIVALPTLIIGVLNILLIRGIKFANARRAKIMVQLDCANRQLDQCSRCNLRYNSSAVKAEGESAQPHRHLSQTQELRENHSHAEHSVGKDHSHFIRVEKSNRSRSGEVNRLCVGIIVIYLLCELPAVGYQVIWALKNQLARDVTRPVTNALVCLNSGINFFVYVFLGRRFRSQLKSMLRNLWLKCSSCDPAKKGLAWEYSHQHHPDQGPRQNLEQNNRHRLYPYRDAFRMNNRSTKESIAVNVQANVGPRPEKETYLEADTKRPSATSTTEV